MQFSPNSFQFIRISNLYSNNNKDHYNFNELQTGSGLIEYCDSKPWLKHTPKKEKRTNNIQLLNSYCLPGSSINFNVS